MNPFFFALGLALAAQSATARAEVRCHETPEGDTLWGTIQCENSGGDAEVLFRKMPAWGPNAGLMVIDICRLSDATKFPELGGALPYSWRPLATSELTKWDEPDPTCVRRWCTDKMSHFSFAIDNLVIPFPSWSLGISFAIRHDSFKVVCETLPASFPRPPVTQQGGEP